MGKKKGVSKNHAPPAPAFDIWDQKDEKGNAKAITEPQPVKLAPGWDANPDMIHRPKGEVRKRKVQYVKPNKVAAVELPHEGQSFNPQVDAHQEALGKAVRKLEKQKASHEKFVEWMSIGKSKEEKSLFGKGIDKDRIGGDINYRKKKQNGDDDGDDVPGAAEDDEDDDEDEQETPGFSGNKTKKRRSDVPKKRHIKMVYRKDVRKSRDDRRHPDRDAIADDVDDLGEMMEELKEQQEFRYRRMVRRKIREAEGQQTKKIGRHVHHPLPLEVQPTGQLAGNLRHVKAGEIHPLQHRMKSLEARNLIPARMRHTYCKNKKPKAPGEVMVRREPFGLMPDVSDRQ